MSLPPFLKVMLPTIIGGAAERRTSPKAFALGEVDLTKSKTEGAALQSNAVEGADYWKVVS